MGETATGTGPSPPHPNATTTITAPSEVRWVGLRAGWWVGWYVVHAQDKVAMSQGWSASSFANCLPCLPAGRLTGGTLEPLISSTSGKLLSGEHAALCLLFLLSLQKGTTAAPGPTWETRSGAAGAQGPRGCHPGPQQRSGSGRARRLLRRRRGPLGSWQILGEYKVPRGVGGSHSVRLYIDGGCILM